MGGQSDDERRPSRKQPEDVTRLLDAWSGGDRSALDRLLPLVYHELRQVARRRLESEREGHTLQATALVHEAYVRLAGGDLQWQNRAHFFALAATAMRRILVDHARSRAADKRGGDAEVLSLDRTGIDPTAREGDVIELLALDQALEALAAQDPRKARVIEAHVFAGLTQRETAEALGISPATVERDLRLARAWLARALAEGSA
jgi:RNA polymerase sigma factor (TIGR02999 family)